MRPGQQAGAQQPDAEAVAAVAPSARTPALPQVRSPTGIASSKL